MDKSCNGTLCNESGTPILGMVVKLPLGEYFVEVCGKGAHSVNRAVKGSSFVPDVSVNVMESNSLPKSDEKPGNNQGPQLMMQKMLQWFHYYFTDPIMFEKTFPKPFEICVPNSTALQKEVWTTLQQRAQFGYTVSYGELANYANRPRAARAIGSAMKNNPNCIIVPCHRVIKASSEIGNYNGGANIKVWLLDHEKKMRNQAGLPAKSG